MRGQPAAAAAANRLRWSKQRQETASDLAFMPGPSRRQRSADEI
jgi:hypothetical protein